MTVRRGIYPAMPATFRVTATRLASTLGCWSSLGSRLDIDDERRLLTARKSVAVRSWLPGLEDHEDDAKPGSGRGRFP